MKNNKPNKSDIIEANNLIEEVTEILGPCINCGLCKSICPVFKVLRDEVVSPRGKVIVLSDKVLDKVIFECTLCKGCEQRCPLGIKVCDAIGKAREAMVLKMFGRVGILLGI